MNNILNNSRRLKLLIQHSMVSLFLTCLLTACVSGTPKVKTQYYLLDAAVKVKPSSLPKRQVKLNQIQFPSYLSQTNLVMKVSDQQIKVANYHRWADNLAESAHRFLTTEINNHSDVHRVMAHCRDCPSVTIEIQHFYLDSDGLVVLSGGYRYQDATNSNKTQQEKTKSKVAYFRFEETQTESGYNSSVAVMQTLMKRLAAEIINAIDSE